MADAPPRAAARRIESRVLYDRPPVKIAVIGAGAMGSIFGARLQEGGHDVILVDVVEPLVAKINKDGVTLVRGKEERAIRVPATTDTTSVGRVDVVIFFTK
jgi:2-dehydropantoate 2-reductase